MPKLAFALSYLRTLRKIIEEPDIVPGARRDLAAAIRKVAQDRSCAVHHPHAAAQPQASRASRVLSGRRFRDLGSGFGSYARRTSFGVDGRDRAVEVSGGRGKRGDVVRLVARRADRIWAEAAQHLLLLALIGSILADASLKEFRKIPFTCSYLPGKTKSHLVFWFGIIPLVVAIQYAAQWEQRAMASPLVYSGVAGALCAVAFTARKIANASAGEILFEEFASDELIGLGLSR